jgi:thioredoxin reductase/bacterioferritin-associated ferredoxin
MGEAHDVIVIGGGPAGANAALSAAEVGARVLLIDENLAAGGQVYRALPCSFSPGDDLQRSPDFAAGQRLRARLNGSSVETAFDHLVWSVAPGFRIDAFGPGGPVSWSARTLVLAAGTTERVVPFPGWTTPGVIGLAAATILLKSQNVLPGRRTMVAGAGPLLSAVAYGIVKAGGEVACVADLNARRDWISALPAMASRPDLLARGVNWLAAVRRTGAPLYFRHAVRSVVRHKTALRIEIGAVNSDGHPVGEADRVVEADALAVGHGLTPATEITRLLGAEHVFDERAGGWRPVRDDDLKSSVDGLFVVGDGAGVSGAAAAELEGSLAGLAAARDTGYLSRQAYSRRSTLLRRHLARASRFGRAMAVMMALKPSMVSSIPSETIVCRCEDVTRAEIDSAIAAGARDVNQLKAWTRCGMGPCQGRMCGEAAACLMAESAGGRAEAGMWTARVPIRPLPLSALVGDFDYEDIPIPGPAPL